MKKPENRRWVINRKIIVEKRIKDGHCRVCKKVLSKYNLTNYCFNHQHERQKIEDMENAIKIDEASKKYRKRIIKRKDKRCEPLPR